MGSFKMHFNLWALIFCDHQVAVVGSCLQHLLPSQTDGDRSANVNDPMKTPSSSKSPSYMDAPELCSSPEIDAYDIPNPSHPHISENSQMSSIKQYGYGGPNVLWWDQASFTTSQRRRANKLSTNPQKTNIKTLQSVDATRFGKASSSPSNSTYPHK